MIDLRLMQPPAIAPVALAKRYRVDVCEACSYEADCRENVCMGGAALCEIVDGDEEGAIAWRRGGGRHR